jgi:hypothetical protein
MLKEENKQEHQSVDRDDDDQKTSSDMLVVIQLKIIGCH